MPSDKMLDLQERGTEYSVGRFFHPPFYGLSISNVNVFKARMAKDPPNIFANRFDICYPCLAKQRVIQVHPSSAKMDGLYPDDWRVTILRYQTTGTVGGKLSYEYWW